MKTSTLAVSIVALLVIVGGGYYWYMHNGAPASDTSGTPATSQTPPIAQVGEDCGGNMQNAPVCTEGTTCTPNPESHLPFGDVGGTCVANNPAMYVSGNLLLGTDSTSTLGTYLIAYNGMTLYTYTKDKTASSTCYGQCAVNWPPYVVASTDALANIQGGVTGKVDSITRADGSLQVTYKDQPLYFYIHDTQSGDITGQNVGKVWFVVKP